MFMPLDIEPYYIKKDNLYAIPVCHYRMEFALQVNRAIQEIKPDCIAVELPSTLESLIKEAVGRFPYLSVIFYQNKKNDYIYFPIEPTDPMAEALRWGLENNIPVHCIDLDTDEYPLMFDPMPDSYAVHCLGLKTYHQLYEEVVESGEKPRITTWQDEMREMEMIYHLQRLTKKHKKVLFVCGMAHIHNILEEMETPAAKDMQYEQYEPTHVKPMGKIIRKDLRLFNLSADSIREVTGENPYIISLYEILRGKHDVEKEIEETQPGKETAIPETLQKEKEGKVFSFLDRRKQKDREQGIAREYPETKPRKDAGELLKKIDNENKKATESQSVQPTGGVHFLIKKPKPQLPGRKQPAGSFEYLEPDDGSEDGTVEFALLGTDKDGGNIFIPIVQDSGNPNDTGVPHTSHRQEDNKARNIFNNFMKRIFGKLFQKTEKITPHAASTPTEEKEFFDDWLLTFEREPNIQRENIHKFRSSEDRRDELLRFYDQLTKLQPDFDRQVLILEAMKQAAKYYKENVNEEIKRWQMRIFMKFSQNWARLSGGLLPDLYQMIVSARSCADDNFAYEAWDILTYYPWIDHSGMYQTVDIRADEVWLNGKKITLRRKFPYLRKRLMRVPVKERKKEKRPGDWAKEYDGNWICSYPPEDIVIEDYGTYLRKKGVSILKEENSRVMPFTTSLLDGVDIRETLRNWHEKKLYVKEETQLPGGVGSVVLIFDEDQDNNKFPWKMTWQGEHNQESDLALYSTHPANKIVGPGISRCEYGGFMMTYPPMRVWDVWSDPLYTMAQSKPEVLLMAAIEYSLEKHVVYVAAKPPRSFFKTFANRLNKSVIYIPIGKMSPVTLKKIRVFHVLSGHKVREIAGDYVW